MVRNLTETVWVKHEYNDEESMDLGRRMAMAESLIAEKSDTLKSVTTAIKSVTTAIKAEIAAQEEILHSCAEKLRSGYEMRPQEADVKYESGVVKYVDKDTGEILKERPMTKDEQLKLTEQVTDAEDIIREASEEEDG
jgi:uncharacterized FlaG/YvyC family protein